MTKPGRIYISCADADAKSWRSRVLTAWAPLETGGGLEIWYREREQDVGSAVEYHCAVLLVTAEYFTDTVAKNELSRFIDYAARGRGLFWIPIADALFQLTELGKRKIQPAWGAQGGGENYETVVSLNEWQYGGVWKEVAVRITKWWAEVGSKLPDKLEDTSVDGKIVTEPRSLTTSVAQIKSSNPAFLHLLPCLINRERQEMRVRQRLAAEQGEIVYVVPAPPDERPDRFADRLDGYTLAEIRRQATARNNLEFCRAIWPRQNQGDTPRQLFELYLDSVCTGVLKATRLENLCDLSRADAEVMDKVARALKPAMRDTRFVFWSEAIVPNPASWTKELFKFIFAWWGRFASAKDSGALSPIVVLAIGAPKRALSSWLPNEPFGAHVAEVAELPPIVKLDMINWLAHPQVQGFNKTGELRRKVNEFFADDGERKSFALVDREVAKWLVASG